MATPVHGRGRLQLELKYDKRTSVVFCLIGSARDLQAHDRWNRQSDPYIICELRNKTSGKAYGDVKTQVFQQTLRPDFNTSFNFDLNPAREDEDGTWRLHIEMWDFDRIVRDDFMGSMSFAIEDIVSTEPSGWFYLLDKQEGALHNVPVITPSLSAIRPRMLQDTLGALKPSDSPLRRSQLQSPTSAVRPVSTLWREEIDPEFYESLSVLERLRQEAIHELINTEQRYCDDMDLVLQTYNFEKCEGIITHEEYMQMFGHLADLRDISQQLLSMLNHRQGSESGIVHRVGDVLQTYIPIMEPAYTIHCQKSDQISAMIAAKTKENPKFAQFLDAGRAQCGSLDIFSFRLKPLQRITKYPLLIKEILRHTDQDHPDRLPVEKALAVSSEVVSRVNDYIRSEELQTDLMLVKDRLNIPPHLKGFVLVSPGVRLCSPSLECTLIKAAAKKKSSVLLKSTKSVNDNRRRLLLLDDSVMGPFLVITQVQGPGTEFLLYPRIVLKDLQVLAAGTGDPHDFSLRFETPWPWETTQDQVLLLRGRELHETNEWLAALESLREKTTKSGRIDDGNIHLMVQDITDTAQKLKLQVTPLNDVEAKLITASTVINSLINRLQELEVSHTKEKKRSYKQLCDLIEIVRAQEQIRAYENATEMMETVRKEERERCMLEMRTQQEVRVIYDPPRKRDSTSYDPSKKRDSSPRAVASQGASPSVVVPSSAHRVHKTPSLPSPPDYSSLATSKTMGRSRSRSLETLSVLDEEDSVGDPRLNKSMNPDMMVQMRGGAMRRRSASRPESMLNYSTANESDAGSVAASQGTPSTSPKSPKRTSPRSQSLKVHRSSHRGTLSDHNKQTLELDPSLPGNSTV